jgi:peptidylprolyl isomerase
VGPSGNSQLGISNADPLLLVFDVLGPDSVDEPYAEEGTGFAPDLVLDEDGKPESMRFKDRPRPTGRLQVQVVVEGDGEVVKKSDVVMVDYLGSVYAKPKPFDGSYDGDPLVQSLSGLVPGWQEALAGKTVGSRVWMALPPRFGYGASGNEGAGIKGTDTIYFLVDILARAPKPVQPEPEETEEPQEPEQPQQSGSSQPSPSADASESPLDDES